MLAVREIDLQLIRDTLRGPITTSTIYSLIQHLMLLNLSSHVTMYVVYLFCFLAVHAGEPVWIFTPMYVHVYYI